MLNSLQEKQRNLALAVNACTLQCPKWFKAKIPGERDMGIPQGEKNEFINDIWESDGQCGQGLKLIVDKEVKVENPTELLRFCQILIGKQRLERP